MNARAAKALESSVTLLLLTIVSAFLAGCSSSPSSGDGEREIQNRINQESEGRVKLVKFQKVNGTQGELMGFKIYALEFNAEIEFAEDCKWVIGFMGTQVSFRTTRLPPKLQDGMAAFIEASQNPGMQVSKGQHVRLVGVVRFVKKENGWSVEGVEITKGDVENVPEPRQTVNTKPLNEGAKVGATKTEIAILKVALDAYKVDTGQYPKGKNGLNDLIQKPSDAQKWYGPYLSTDKLPRDPWGHGYIYECPGQHNPDAYDLMSMGPDGRVGGGDDISNWPQEPAGPSPIQQSEGAGSLVPGASSRDVGKTYVLQPGPDTSKDIWTTSMYSCAPGGDTPGGGMNDHQLRVGGWGDFYYSLLQFDLGSLPKSPTSAILYLYCFKLDGEGTALYLDRITGAWDWRTSGTGRDRDRLWWADKPTTAPWRADPLEVPVQGQWYAVDITDLYRAWQTGTYPNYGVQIRPVSNNNNFDSFYSGDYADDPTLRPKLVVTAPKGENPVANPLIQTGRNRIVGKWNWGWTDGKVSQVTYIKADGSLESSNNSSGHWKCLDEQEQLYELLWDVGGWVNRVQLSADANSLVENVEGNSRVRTRAN